MISVRIKLTMSGLVGSGSVPVIPDGVGVGVVVELDEVVEVELVPEANARSAGPASRTRNMANASLRTAYLDMGESPYERKSALGGD